MFTFILLVGILLVTPLSSVNAESSSKVYYPTGIDDYVDLNNITNFAVNNDQIFYSKDRLNVICYDKSTKTSKQLVKNVNQGTINNMQVAGEYLFIFSTLGKSYIYKLSDLTTADFPYAPVGFNSVSVHYMNGKYYIGYISTKSGINSFNLITYASLSQSGVVNACSNTFSTEILGSKIVLSDSLIAIKPLTGEKIYLIKDYSTATELTLLSSNSGNYYEITGFDDTTKILDLAIVEYSDNVYTNRIFIGYEGSPKTQICNFNGTKLTYEDDNNIISNKLCVHNNQLYVYNSENADINLCVYDTLTNEFNKSNLILAGKGSELGRFKDASCINYKSGSLYVADSGNDRIQIINEGGITPCDRLNSTIISDIVVDSNNNYYYTVYRSSSNMSYLYINDREAHIFSNTKIISIAINLDDTLYLITTNQIITYRSKSNITFKSFVSLTLNENSKLRILNNYTNNATPISGVVAESLYLISINNSLYPIDPTTGKTATKSLLFSSNIRDFKINPSSNNNPIFILFEDGKFVRTSLTENQDNKVVLSGFSDYSCFGINQISGELYMYNTNLSAIEIYNNTNFCTPANLTHYNTNAYNSTGFTELWQYTQIKSKALIYDYYNFVGDYIELNEVTNAIVLEVPVNSENGQLGEFAYVGYTLNNQLQFGYVETADLVDGIKPVAVSDSTYKLRITGKNVAVYKYPSIFNDYVFKTYEQGYIIDTYGKYISSIDNYVYYIVKIGNEYGYICSNDVTLSEKTTKNIKTNATIKIFDGSETINVYLADDENSSIMYRLTDGYKINVEDYNKNNKFTKITFIDEDQQEREGYVLTSYVKLSGISTTVITAIILLVLDIIIAIIVIIFYHHYKKKQKENSK